MNTSNTGDQRDAVHVWQCAAIDHGVTIFPNGKIGPCCLINSSYLKPIDVLTDPDRFADLRTPADSPPLACHECTLAEHYGDTSYRQTFNSQRTQAPGVQFLDIRNSNLCNLKCRTCGPHFSNKWGDELGYEITIKRHDITEHLPYLLTDDLHWMYFTGGEPLINKDHWDLLETLITSGRSRNIKLMYNTNMTTLKYKNTNIVSIWRQFAGVTVNCSIDAVGEKLNYIRSGADWREIKKNFDKLYRLSQHWDKFAINLTPTMSLLNIWFFAELVKFASDYNITCKPIILSGPKMFALSVIPDSLTDLALEQLTLAATYNVVEPATIDRIKKLIVDNNMTQWMNRTIREILLMDHVRRENLFGLLPFTQEALATIHQFDEYK